MTPTGRFYYAEENAHEAAKLLSKKAEELFKKAQIKAGITPVRDGGKTAEGFLPTSTAINP